MPRKAKHLTVADLEAIVAPEAVRERLLPYAIENEAAALVMSKITAIRLRSWARSEIARRAKAGAAARKVEGKENGSIQ